MRRLTLCLVVALWLAAAAASESTPLPPDAPVFEATDEWQVVPDGYQVPGGVHVRLNLQTGLREVRLLPPDERDPDGAVVAVDEDDGGSDPPARHRPEHERRTEQLTTPEELRSVIRGAAAANKQEGVLDTNPEAVAEDDPRYLEWLRDQLERVSVLGHVEQALPEADRSVESRLEALAELEELVHDLDNAQELVSYDASALSAMIQMLNDTSEDADVRAATAMVLGAASQNNAPVQEAALDKGILDVTLEISTNSAEPLVLRRRSLFALSATLRASERAQQHFVMDGGLALLLPLVQNTDQPALTRKVLHLIVDFAAETEDMSFGGRVIAAMPAQNFCMPLALVLVDAVAAGVDPATTEVLPGMARDALQAAAATAAVCPHATAAEPAVATLRAWLARVEPDAEIAALVDRIAT